MSDVPQMQRIPQESNVEDVLIADDSVIQKQKNSLNTYIQSLTSNQLLIKTNELSINFELSDSESEEFTLREKSLQDISTVGYNFREHYLNSLKSNTKAKRNKNSEQRIQTDDSTKKKEQIDFVVANLNLIVKKENEHKKENISVAIKLEQDKNYFPIAYSSAYHFDTSSAENEEKISVKRRLESAEKIIDSLKLKYDDPNKTNNGCFDQRFRHGEQALFEYLKTDGFILYLIDYMHRKNVIKLQSVVLDIYSTKNMCKNCQYSTYGVLSDKIEQENQEFCGKLEQQIKKDNETRIEKKRIVIEGTIKKGGEQRTTFYRAVRLVFSEFFDNQFKNQRKLILNRPIYIQNIDKRVIAMKYSNLLLKRYNSLIKKYTIFCSRGKSEEKRLIKQLKTDREYSKNETDTKNNGGENGNLEQKDLMMEE